MITVKDLSRAALLIATVVAMGTAVVAIFSIATSAYPMTVRAKIQNLSECVLEDQYGSLCWSDTSLPKKTTVYSSKMDNVYKYCHMALPLCTAPMLSDVNLNPTLQLIEDKVGETNHDESKTWEVKITPNEGMYAALQGVKIHKDGVTIVFTSKETTFNGAVVTIEELSDAGIEIPELDWEKFLIVDFTQE